MFISVIPAVKMPFGHCFFDYEVIKGDTHVGDLILVPFRKQKIAALVAKKSPTSSWEGKAIKIECPQKIAKLPEGMADFCISAAAESFVSPPTMLNAWLRTVPKKHTDPSEIHTPPRNTYRPKDSAMQEQRFLANRYSGENGIIQTVLNNQANGRILVLTPWKKRADYLALKLGTQALHADTPYGAAWKIWTDFLSRSHAVMAATRLGAWLAAAADLVILDEPENDDFKQDELTPRYDARRLVLLAKNYNPALRIISINTTPNLEQFYNNQDLEAAEIRGDILFTRQDRANRSDLEMITRETFNEMELAVQERRPIRILHTVKGMRGRVRCADCDWTMYCESCDIGMHNMRDHALCTRCNLTKPLPALCPACGSLNLSKAVIGADGLARAIKQRFPNADIKVMDLPEWLQQPLRPGSLLIATNIAYIGGYSEDIKRKERLVIAFRRLAAQSCVAKCKLVAQGNSPLIDSAPSWLNAEGVKKTWQIELKDRQAFAYPPSQTVIKLIMMGKYQDSSIIKDKLETFTSNNPGWGYRGPFPVEYASKTREPRHIFHILPPKNLTREVLIDELSVLTSYGIIDLDPIAFFC